MNAFARLRAPLTLVLCMLCVPAWAQLAERRVTLGGFGTLGATYHDEEGLQYRRSIMQPDGAEAGRIDFAVDSLAGAQVNAAWSGELEAVGQVIARAYADEGWQPQLTRGFVRYTPNATLRLRTGRIGWETFQRADSRNIGYSQLTVRPATEVFGVAPIESIDGADLELTHPVQSALLRLHLYYGVTSGEAVPSQGSVTDLDGTKVWGGSLDYVHGPWLVHLDSGVFMFDDPSPFGQLAVGLRAAGSPGAVALAEDFERRERRLLFLGIGASYDDGPTQARAFYARSDTDRPGAPNVDLGLFTVGYSLGEVTPFAQLSFVDSYEDVRDPGLPDVPELQPLITSVLGAQHAAQYNQASVTAGLRYDVRPKVALKLQVDQVWLHGSVLVLENGMPQQGFERMTVFGAALDFVF